MKIKSPEHWIASFIKSATNGRKISVRARRVLTLIVIPIWLLGLIISIQGLVKARKGIRDYKEANVLLDDMNTLYPNSAYYSKANARLEMREAERKADGYFYSLYYILLCFIMPWVLLKLIFWVVDADK